MGKEEGRSGSRRTSSCPERKNRRPKWPIISRRNQSSFGSDFCCLGRPWQKGSGKVAAKAQRQRRRSQTPEESASRLISKKSLHSFWESVFSVFAMGNKFHFSGIAAVATAVRQWIFGKSKAGADGGGLGLASEPEEQEETGGSRIALLILLASLTALALWAQCWDDKGTYTCISAFSGCKPRTGTSGSL